MQQKFKAALEQCQSRNWKPDSINCEYLSLVKAVHSFEECVTWRLGAEVDRLKTLLKQFPYLMFEAIDREENSINDQLTNYAHQNPSLALFFRGLDLPCW